MTLRRKLAAVILSGLAATATLIGFGGSASADQVVVYQHAGYSGYSATWTYYAGSGITNLATRQLYGPRTSISADNAISSVKNQGNSYYSFFTGTFQTGSRMVLPPWVYSSQVPHNDQYSSTWAG